AERKAAEEKRLAEAAAAEKARAEEARKAEEAQQAEDARKEAERKAAEAKAAEEKRIADARIAAEQHTRSETGRSAPTTSEPSTRSKFAEARVANVLPRRKAASHKTNVRPARKSERAGVRQSRRYAVTHKCKGKNSARSRKKRLYVVKRGETLWSISRRALKKGSRYASIVGSNGKRIRHPHRVYPCQKLRLPRT
ncbi:LysM peptidoglycan-binding domain-containing protein, partial [Hyphomicrobium zavarzinii]|uniref:LysM peptidoglycan-binding domain-containing protein n=1 Tax=Hyphomicrobium zavarzinii TaxID=48292 RepID=UPI0018DE965C